MVRTSERMTFLKCRWQWQREFVDLLRPAVSAPALRFGTLVHAAMEAYYKPGTKRGPAPHRTFKKLAAKDVEEAGHLGYRDEDGVWSNAIEMGYLMLEAYSSEYGKDEKWRVIATEQPFETPIKNPATGRTVGVYVGIMDGIWQNLENDELWVPDHKTAKAINTKYLALDEQAGAYWTFGVDWIRAQGMLKDDQQLSGMLYNFLRKGKPDTRPTNTAGQSLNENGSVSKQQPVPLFLRQPVYRDEVDGARVRERVYQQMYDMYMVRRGEYPAYKTPGSMNCGMCAHFDVCELHETGADWEEFARQTMVIWDPYSEHELRESR